MPWYRIRSCHFSLHPLRCGLPSPRFVLRPRESVIDFYFSKPGSLCELVSIPRDGELGEREKRRERANTATGHRSKVLIHPPQPHCVSGLPHAMSPDDRCDRMSAYTRNWMAHDCHMSTQAGAKICIWKAVSNKENIH